MKQWSSRVSRTPKKRHTTKHNGGSQGREAAKQTLDPEITLSTVSFFTNSSAGHHTHTFFFFVIFLLGKPRRK
jgi:hypothetical protein